MVMKSIFISLILKQQRSVSIHNPIKMFEKIMYDDTEESFESISNQDYSKYENKFVKVIVVNKENPYWFDAMLDKLHKANPLHLSVVDDHKHMDLLSDEEMEGVEDTLTILHKYVENLEVQGDKNQLSNLVTSLYNEGSGRTQLSMITFKTVKWKNLPFIWQQVYYY